MFFASSITAIAVELTDAFSNDCLRSGSADTLICELILVMESFFSFSKVSGFSMDTIMIVDYPSSIVWKLPQGCLSEIVGLVCNRSFQSHSKGYHRGPFL